MVPSNHLYLEMVRAIRLIKPRFFLFENVRGLVTGRWTRNGVPGEIWADVREAFGNLQGYDIGWKLVHAKDYGVPQNRPRIILIGVRRDLGLGIPCGTDTNALDNPRGLIPEGDRQAPDLIEVLSDLDDPDFESKPETPSYLFPAEGEYQREMRRDPLTGRTRRTGQRVSDQVYSRHSKAVRDRFAMMHEVGGGILPARMRTKKFNQRLLPAYWHPNTGPTITVTSLPDDFVHYRRPRILTVREWARLQTFPDWFEFVGKRTTGGVKRAGDPAADNWHREVPRYTQIGNAVPVRLSAALGRHLIALLRQL